MNIYVYMKVVMKRELYRLLKTEHLKIVDTITVSHRDTWKTLQSVIGTTAPKGWSFPTVNGELTIGQIWKDNKWMKYAP